MRSMSLEKLSSHAAHLAHGQHDVAGAGFRVLGMRQLQLAAARRLGQQEAHRIVYRRVGQVRQRVRHVRDRPDAADIGQRDQQRAFRLHPPQQAHGIGFVRRYAAMAAPVVGEQACKMRVGIALQHAHEPRDVAMREIPEIRRAVGSPGDQVAHLADARR